MIEDSSGLICGFVLHRDGPSAPITKPTLEAPDPVWLHFNLSDARAAKWIEQCPQLPARAKDIFATRYSHIRLEPVGDGLAGVLGDLHFEFKADPEELGYLHLFLCRDFIVTGRLHPLKAMDRLRLELLEGIQIAGPMHLLMHLVDLVAEDFDELTADLSDTVEQLEDRVWKGWFYDQGGELGRIRRLLARVRRHVTGERHALARIQSNRPVWCGDLDGARLTRATERLDMIGEDVELLQERARLLQEEILNRVGEATNRNLYLLSIVTALFLPVTLVTGLFGMNVGGLPWLEDPWGFWWVSLQMLAVGAMTLAALRWLRIL